MSCSTCDFCGVTVGYYGDYGGFSEQLDGSIVCDDCAADPDSGAQTIHCEICGEDKSPDDFVDETVPVCADCLHSGCS